MSSQQPPAGWYPDPKSPGTGDQRYWDGSTWTEHVHVPVPVPPVPPAPPVPVVAQSPAVVSPGWSAAGGPAAAPYQMPQAVAVANVTKSPGMAIASLVLGIGAFFFAWLPILGFFSLPFAIVGLVLGIAGYRRARKGFEGRGLSIAGMASSALAIGVFFLVGALFTKALGDAADQVAKDFGPAPPGSYELQQLSCTAGEFGGLSYKGSLTNATGEVRSYEVKVSFYDGNRRLGSQESDYVMSVPAGGTASVEVTSFEDGPSNVRCQVDGVDLAGS
ncbi:MAG: DUF2510 domain-containing protein, partial [Actinomycetes bacterium]